MKFLNNVNPTYSFGLYQMDKVGYISTAKNVFSEEDLDTLHKFASLQTPSRAVVKGKKDVSAVRSAEVVFLKPEDHVLESVFKKLIQYTKHCNEENYRFRIGFMESVQYTIYNEGDFYHWHLDTFDGGHNMFYEQRKLSLTVQLSDPVEYEGGELEFFNPDNPITAPKEKGAVVLFPSYLYHRIKPVTKGKRISLVAWFAGPDFC